MRNTTLNPDQERDLTEQIISDILDSEGFQNGRQLAKVSILLKVEQIRGQVIRNRISANKLAMLDTQLDCLLEFIGTVHGGICRITDLPEVPQNVFAHGIRQEKFKLIPKNGDTIVLLSENLIEAL